jgi:Phage tail lysozyme
MKTAAIRAAKASPALGVAGALVAALATHGATVAAPSAAVNRAKATADSRADHPAAANLASHSARLVTSSPAQAGWLGPYHPLASGAGHSGAKPATAKHQAAKHGVTTLKCTGTSGMLPENYAAIMAFLTKHGYTKMAAAGIAGNMYQESKGDPESVGTGGGGLIGFTPLPAGYVTGNPARDLHTQLEAVLSYNQQWAQYIPALNAATTPTQAADIYMNDFERPGIPAAYNREGAASAVAAACGF